jgi:ABC-type multidrug transport system fused ATPase/permease subunit
LREQSAGAQALVFYSGPYKWLAIGNGLLSVLGIALQFVPILMVQPLIDRVFHVSPQASDREFPSQPLHGPARIWVVALLVGAILFASALGALVSIMRGRTAAYLGARVIHDIRSQVYEQLQRLSVATTTNAK